MKIKVTQKDIDKASFGCNTCPISQAIMRQLNIEYVSTFPISGIKFNGKIYNAPKSAQRFISKFDNKRPVKPFNFILGKRLE
jgi:hypothetical protein